MKHCFFFVLLLKKKKKPITIDKPFGVTEAQIIFIHLLLLFTDKGLYYKFSERGMEHQVSSR